VKACYCLGWVEFQRKLRRPGLESVKLVISDAHGGVKAALTTILSAIQQRCRLLAAVVR
jgi:transposase-like protein